MLLPDEPDHIAEGFDPDNAFLEAAEGSGSWYDHSSQKRLLRLWGLSLGMTLDLLAHLPSASPSPRIWSEEEAAPLTIDTDAASTAAGPSRLGPKTPVTVTSSFDDDWETARRAIDRKSPAAPNGLTPLPNGSAAGSRVGTERGGPHLAGPARAARERQDVQGFEARRRAGRHGRLPALLVPRHQLLDLGLWPAVQKGGQGLGRERQTARQSQRSKVS